MVVASVYPLLGLFHNARCSEWSSVLKDLLVNETKVQRFFIVYASFHQWSLGWNICCNQWKRSTSLMNTSFHQPPHECTHEGTKRTKEKAHSVPDVSWNMYKPSVHLQWVMALSIVMVFPHIYNFFIWSPYLSWRFVWYSWPPLRWSSG